MASTASVPALKVVTARSLEAGDSDDAVPIAEARTDATREGRPRGRRFGELVHGVLARVAFEITRPALAAQVERLARTLLASGDEQRWAVEAAWSALHHPLLEAAAKADEVRREAPVTYLRADGVLIEGVVDLAFRSGETWQVVEFKTDDTLERHRDEYVAQTRAYVAAISAATAKWNPPPGFQAELSRATAEQAALQAQRAPAPTPKQQEPVRPPMPSGVDRTLDDGDMSPMHGFPPPRTQIATSPEPPRAMSPTPPPRAASQPTPLPTPPVPHVRRSAPTPTPSKPFSNVDTTLSDAPAPHRFLRYAALFVLLFLVGSAAAAGVLYKIGLLETAPSTRIDDYVTRANDAVTHERWDAPPGNNVRDITNEGLAKWPNDTRLVEIRERASEHLEAKAIKLKGVGDLHGAAHLMRLASELDPTDQGTRALATQFEQEATPHTDASTLMGLTDAGALVTPPRPVPAAGAPRATIDATPAKPKLGQSVEFVAKVLTSAGAAPKSVVTEGRFTIAGPGLGAGADLAAASEGNVFRAGFTFLERGRYEVSFSGKVDGQSVRAARAVVIESPTPPPSTGTVEQPPPPPPPSSSVKWL